MHHQPVDPVFFTIFLSVFPLCLLLLLLLLKSITYCQSPTFRYFPISPSPFPNKNGESLFVKGKNVRHEIYDLCISISIQYMYIHPLFQIHGRRQNNLVSHISLSDKLLLLPVLLLLSSINIYACIHLIRSKINAYTRKKERYFVYWLVNGRQRYIIGIVIKSYFPICYVSAE